MSRPLRRLVVATLPLIAGAVVFASVPAAIAGCATDPTGPNCLPSSPPKPPPTPQPQPTQMPSATQGPAATPRPSTKPKPKATTTRATAAPAPVIEVTPQPSPIEPTFTPEIVVPTAVPTTSPEGLAAKNSGGNTPSAWWAFLIAGIIIGWLAGMLTSGTVRRRRKKQAIFG